MEATPAKLFEAALTLHGQGRRTEAESLYELVLRLDASHLGAVLSWALLCAEQRRVADATRLLDRVDDCQLDSVAAHCCLADVEYALERFDRAAKHYELALKLQPASAEA
ncbi:MAG TPA: tetratricopeptide repeat protein, partial [Chloroflexota bacterium]|nr:tetratricopeptide repeat protein [Chloroflexota bacterium]